MTCEEYLQACKEYDSKRAEIEKYNAQLIDKYPFLYPRDRYTDEPIQDYDYSFTEMDAMPVGWRLAFGDDLLNELNEELLENDYVDDYRIVDIKEKWGGLRWYDNWYSERWNDDILSKYEKMSEKTCIVCGKPATHITKGYIMPVCEDCMKKDEYLSNATPIEEF